jgi:hypothetical protein
MLLVGSAVLLRFAALLLTSYESKPEKVGGRELVRQ